jgi:hypothetical protein
MEPAGSLPHSQQPATCPYTKYQSRSEVFCVNISYQDTFYVQEFLAPSPTSQLEDHPLLAVHDCLFNIFVVTLSIGRRSSIRNLRTPQAVVTGNQLSRSQILIILKKKSVILLRSDQLVTKFRRIHAQLCCLSCHLHYKCMAITCCRELVNRRLSFLKFWSAEFRSLFSIHKAKIKLTLERATKAKGE